MKKSLIVLVLIIGEFVVKAQSVTILDFCYVDRVSSEEGSLITYEFEDLGLRLQANGFSVFNIDKEIGPGAGEFDVEYTFVTMKNGNETIEFCETGPLCIVFEDAAAAERFIDHAVSIGWFVREGSNARANYNVDYGIYILKQEDNSVIFENNVL